MPHHLSTVELGVDTGCGLSVVEAAGAVTAAEGLVDILTRVGRLAETVPELIELDLNPVVVRGDNDSDGCQVLEARVRLAPREPADPFLRRLRV